MSLARTVLKWMRKEVYAGKQMSQLPAVLQTAGNRIPTEADQALTDDSTTLTVLMHDFFISYTQADRTWAEWMAWQLEAAGYTTVIQAWDIRPGANFTLAIQRAATEAERTIAVLSPAYLASRFTQPEWAAAFAQDPTGELGLLLPVRVDDCDLQGLLPQIVYIDLVGLDEADAKAALLSGIQRGRAKPDAAPGFPGAASSLTRTILAQPDFPGLAGLMAQSPPDWEFPDLHSNSGWLAEAVKIERSIHYRQDIAERLQSEHWGQRYRRMLEAVLGLAERIWGPRGSSQAFITCVFFSLIYAYGLFWLSLVSGWDNPFANAANLDGVSKLDWTRRWLFFGLTVFYSILMWPLGRWLGLMEKRYKTRQKRRRPLRVRRRWSRNYFMVSGTLSMAFGASILGVAESSLRLDVTNFSNAVLGVMLCLFGPIIAGIWGGRAQQPWRALFLGITSIFIPTVLLTILAIIVIFASFVTTIAVTEAMNVPIFGVLLVICGILAVFRTRPLIRVIARVILGALAITFLAAQSINIPILGAILLVICGVFAFFKAKVLYSAPARVITKTLAISTSGTVAGALVAAGVLPLTDIVIVICAFLTFFKAKVFSSAFASVITKTLNIAIAGATAGMLALVVILALIDASGSLGIRLVADDLLLFTGAIVFAGAAISMNAGIRRTNVYAAIIGTFMCLGIAGLMLDLMSLIPAFAILPEVLPQGTMDAILQLSDQKQPFIYFTISMLILPAANGGLDYASWWVSRCLGQDLYDGLSGHLSTVSTLIRVLIHITADLLLALFFFVAMAFILGLAAESYNLYAHRPEIILPTETETIRTTIFAETEITLFAETEFGPFGYLEDLRAAPLGAGLWITLMLLTTLIPTVIHFGMVVGAILPATLLPDRRRQSLAANLAALSQTPPADADARAAWAATIRDSAKFAAGYRWRMLWGVALTGGLLVGLFWGLSQLYPHVFLTEWAYLGGVKGIEAGRWLYDAAIDTMWQLFRGTIEGLQ